MASTYKSNITFLHSHSELSVITVLL